jgi:hypothetical protein
VVPLRGATAWCHRVVPSRRARLALDSVLMSAMVSGVVLIAVLAALAALACVLALAAFRRAGAREHPRHD